MRPSKHAFPSAQGTFTPCIFKAQDTYASCLFSDPFRFLIDLWCSANEVKVLPQPISKTIIQVQIDFTILDSIHESHNKENKVVARMSPYLTALSVSIGSDRDTLKLSQFSMFQQSCLLVLTKIGEHIIWARIVQRASLYIESKALVRSTKTWYKYFSWSWMAEKIIFVVSLPDLNLQCVSRMIRLQILFLSRVNRSFAKNFNHSFKQAYPESPHTPLLAFWI